MSAPETWFLVKRSGPGRERRSYGLFEHRELADRVALAAIEKHPGGTVTVEPVSMPARRAL